VKEKVEEKQENEGGQQGQLFVRGLPLELLGQLERFCEENNKSKKDVIAEALELYFASAGKPPALKLIPLKYPSKCSKCGRQLQAAELAYWAPGTVVCVECYLRANSGIGDAKKALKAYMDYKRFKAMAVEAQRELDVLVRQIDERQILNEMKQLKSEIEKALALLNDYTYHFEDTKAKEALQLLTQVNEKIDELLASRALIVKKAVSERKREWRER
jgi:methyl-accepting chemotaxis protein